ncbi:MAG: hypothetical protein WCS84_06785 [Nocardioides sp.]
MTGVLVLRRAWSSLPAPALDDLRVGSDGVLVGMSYVDRPVLRRGGLPFLLRR